MKKTFQKIIAVIALSLAVIPSFADETAGTLTVADFEIEAGKTTPVDVILHQSLALTAIQVDIVLPEGFSFYKGYYDEDDEDYFLVSKADSKFCKSSHTIASNIRANGNLAVSIISTQNAAFKSSSNDATLFTFYVKAGDNLEGKYTMKLVDAELTEAESLTPHYPAATETTITCTTAGINDIVMNEGECTYYTVDGKKIAEPANGLTIVRTSNGETYKIIK